MKKIAIHCPTELLAKLLLKFFDKKGFKWSNGDSYLEDTEWDSYRENTCYCYTDGTFSSIYFFKSNSDKYQIVSAESFLFLHLKYLL